jgi:PAS domain S-box-containing protein
VPEPVEPHPVPEGTPGVEPLLAQIAELQARLARSEKIKKTLMERVERSVETAGNAYTLFERSILLEQSVSQRTAELKESETAYKVLYDQSHLNEQRLETLYRLNQMADEPLTILCQFAMEEAIRLTGSTIGYLAFVSEDEKVLTMHAWSRSAMQECRIEDKPIIYPVEKTGLWGEAIRQRKPVITNDYSQPNPLKKGCPQGHVSVHRHMNAPIFDGDRIVIVAGVGNKPTDYDETDIRQLTLLMRGMWSLVQRKQTEELLRQNLKRSQDQQQVVGQIAICPDVSDGNVEAAARRMTEQICVTVNVQRAGIWQFNDDRSELRCVDLFDVTSGSHSSGAVLHRHQFCNEFKALETAQYIDAHNALTDPRTAGYVECYLKPLGIASMLDAAIRAGGVNLGILCIEHVGQPRRWQQDEVVFACQLADQIALTFLNRQRRQYEETLRIERQRLASIIEGTHVGTWEWNVQTGETVFNERWAQIVGFTLSELEPINIQTWIRLAHPDDLKESESKLHKHFAGELECYNCECRMKHKDGSWVWIHNRGKVMEWTPDGKPLRMFGTHSDITDRKQSEDNLRKAMKAANAANVAKSQFLANMSHEIRTPMNAILGFAELLAQDKLTPQQSDFVQTIRNSGSHLLDLINDILDFSKIEAGKMTLEFTDCPVEVLLGELESLMAPFAQTKGLRFEMLSPTVLPQTVRTDPVRLRQCLTNLVNNAIKFTEAGHVIVRTTLTESAGKSFLRFEVEDTGPGIDPQVQGKIFEAFEQADGSMTRKFGGTGLGLTITRHLAELFGGSLTLTSELGKGSTFVIAIPTNTDIQSHPVQNRHNSPIPQESSKPLSQQFQGRVLVAEDVKTNQVLVRILLNQVGLQPVIVDDGQAAVEQALRHEFDLILLDMQMPRLNGFEAARKLRKQGIRTPIVALTAGAIKGDERKCLEAGCDEYLTKPINRKELLRVLAQFLQVAAGLQSPA